MQNGPQPILPSSIQEMADSRLSFWLRRCTVPLLVVAVTILLTLGISMIYSATIADKGNHFFKSQLVWIVVGLAGCTAGVLLPMGKIYRKSHWGLIAIFLPLAYLTCAAVAVKFAGASTINFFPFATTIKGAVRWLRFGPINIQPSEFAKVFLVIFLAAYYGTLPREKIKNFVPGLLIPFGASAIILVLILLGKDLSTTFVTAMMTVGIMFLAGVRFKYVLLVITLGAILGTVFIAGSPMRRDRIVAWQHPEEAKEGESYQLFRSQICLGVGNLTGKGYSKGYMKTYLPEPHTDFIVAVIGEELGFLGLLGVLTCYSIMCICIIAIGHQSQQRADMLLCNGIALLIAVQAMVNIGVVSGAIPPTGVTAPFLSYGGSSIISLMFLLGLVLNVSTRNYKAYWEKIGKMHAYQ